MPSRFLKELSRRVLVLDGAMGTAIHERNLDLDADYLGLENCSEILVQTRPDVIQSIHEGYLAAGADAVETDTFGGASHVLAEFGLEGQTRNLNAQAAQIARAACETFATSDRPRFVMGSMGPGTKLPTLGHISWDDLLASYRQQALGLIEGGADTLLIETCQDLLQVKCAVSAVLSALETLNKTPQEIPILVSVTIETTGAMLLGTTIEAAATALRRFPIACLGLNCATGPVEMAEHIHWLAKYWDRHISVVPNAGLPKLEAGQTVYPLGPEGLAETLTRFVEQNGVNIVGGCCGTTPKHIEALAKAIGSRAPATREASPTAAACTSLYSPVEYRQDLSFLIIGERCNASGSRKFKRLLEAEDWDGVVSVAREQTVHDGAHVLDVNVDYAGRDNAADAAEVVHRIARQVDAPLMLDSTQSETIEAGLKNAPGKCIINSANFEDGTEKFDQLCRLAKNYGAALVIGSIDEDKDAAMARTADRKLEIAQRAHDRAVNEHGLDSADLFFDPLVLPVSTGMDDDRRSGLETIQGVRRIAQALPRCQTTAGLSNVSFGLKAVARVVLNSVFLHELRAAGLTSAIVHASKIMPETKIDKAHWAAAMDLLYDRRAESNGGTGLPQGVNAEDHDPLQAFIQLFDDVENVAEERKGLQELPLEERMQRHIIDGEKERLDETLDLAMGKYAPLAIINDHLLEGMKTVGELFGSGKMQLPFVLQSAETMKMAVAHLEPHMEQAEGQTKGKIVLATVKGDVHDIGKNLVDIILTNNGYTVYNLGIKQPIAGIIAKWKETQADAIGLSGLLVKSVNVMEENLAELNANGINAPVILGGAALSRHYCESYLRSVYDGQCLYGKDAFDGLRTMDLLTTGSAQTLTQEIDQRISKRAKTEKTIAASTTASQDSAVAVATRSSVATDIDIPAPPFWGSRVVDDLDLNDIYPFINTIALFRGQWQFKKGASSDEEYQAALQEKIVPVFEDLKAQCIAEQILQPKAVYGYYPANADGTDLVIYDPQDHDREIERFTFPRQNGKKHLCISDFFRPAESGVKDTVALHCVTMGSRVSEIARELFENDDYTQYLYLHGLGVEAAEALAEIWHKRIREELGIASDDSNEIRKLFTQKYRGSRYSFGYPACPEMSDQAKLFNLLRPDRIGCALTENWQIDPEQSTSAIIVHHPQAKYFSL